MTDFFGGGRGWLTTIITWGKLDGVKIYFQKLSIHLIYVEIIKKVKVLILMRPFSILGTEN